MSLTSSQDEQPSTLPHRDLLVPFGKADPALTSLQHKPPSQYNLGCPKWDRHLLSKLGHAWFVKPGEGLS